MSQYHPLWAPFCYVFLPLCGVALLLVLVQVVMTVGCMQGCKACGALRLRGFPKCPRCHARA